MFKVQLRQWRVYGIYNHEQNFQLSDSFQKNILGDQDLNGSDYYNVKDSLF